MDDGNLSSRFLKTIVEQEEEFLMYIGKQLKSLVAFHLKLLYIKLPKQSTLTWLIIQNYENR